MTATSTDPGTGTGAARAAFDPRPYTAAGHTLRSWLTTTDHKRVAILYLIAITGFFALGAVGAVLVRLELATPRPDLLSAETYNRAFTMHGIVMVWFFLIPSIPNVFGNFLIPLMIGARDLAFPRLNLLSWYIYVLAGLFTVVTLVKGGVDTGWTFYTPLSTQFANGHVLLAAAGVFTAGFSSILTGLNFIVTIHTMRAPGMTWFRLPIFVWSHYATSILLVLATPVLAMALILIVAERGFGVGIFDPRLGGDPLLFQHLFWFYSHPAVYIMVLPAMGVVTELISTFAGRAVFGYRFVAYASLAIAALGFLVWGHHMFVSGQSMYASVVFSFLSFLVAVPSAVKVYNWAATLYRAEIRFTAPLLYGLSFIGLFVFGGLTGLILASLALDVHAHDTTFVVAHFHYIMVGGAVTAYLGAMHFWWPKITGRLYPDALAKLSVLLLYVGFNLTFFPQYILGWLGMPRRYHEYPAEFQVWHLLSTAGAGLLAFAYLLPLVYLPWSLRWGQRAGPNPWGATGLEWRVPSPPPTHNFDRIPTVTWEAYTPEATAETKDTPP
ncbi:cbb3-type cytochrome c oxidase subunit I [Azospirillum doebereinerae]|uniref:cytochrome c oxidase subunit I n=1 Tax=Azospirillum doebereinerae TaxID=92933 RepID=UPI001EE60C04|nr:cbb3-type cytochrome c oxidase subunit I [Azospirillum doebereinerae]MCG5239724.1 cbb3-type cytochrome c oxidase subunit I [Azospirillum doebereinerae]